jgi:thymidylate synthase
MKYNSPTQAFESLFKEIKEKGEDYAGTKALFNVSFTVESPLDKVITTPQRKFKEEYAEYEWQWYLEGNRDAKEIADRAKIWKNMMVPGTTNVVSNYGYFWKYNDQYKRVIEELKRNKESRRAVLVHYGIFELDIYKYDTPCNIVLNFYVKEDLLHMTVFARSIDIVFGFSNDQYTFARLMEKASKDVGLPVGTMHWFITNCHLYPRHYDLMER